MVKVVLERIGALGNIRIEAEEETAEEVIEKVNKVLAKTVRGEVEEKPWI